FELASEIRDGRVAFAAIAEGITTLSIVATTNDETRSFTHTLGALPIDSVAISARSGDLSCEAPALFAVGTVALLSLELRSAGTLLHGEAFSAIETDRGTIDV